MLVIDRIEAFDDNYIWAIQNGAQCVVVDPGDAAPVFDYLKHHSFDLKGILLTHWHGDHQGGVEALKAAYPDCVVRGSAKPLKGASIPVVEGEHLEVLGAVFQVLETPGHTLDHVSYVSESPMFRQPVAFTGDTLFAAGCGRLFEGTPAQMYASLAKLNRLPADTMVYCAHEYTLANLRFAVSIEADNEAAHARLLAVQGLRAHGGVTVPTTLSLERETNPFLRAANAEELAVRRQLKDEF